MKIPLEQPEAFSVVSSVKKLAVLSSLILCLFLSDVNAYQQLDSNAISHYQKGQRWFELGKNEAAIREFQIAIRLKPGTLLSAVLYNNMGKAYLKLKDYPKAIVSFQQAIAVNPNFSLYYQNLAQAYQEAGSVFDVINTLQQTTRVNPEDAQTWYLLGMVYQQTGDKQAADRAFHVFRQLMPYSELTDSLPP